MISLMISLAILMALLAGAWLQRRATEWIVTELRTDLKEARQSMSLVSTAQQMIEVMREQRLQLEKLDGQVYRLVASNMISATKVRDLQTGEGFTANEESVGRRERVPIPGANDSLPPEGFVIDGQKLSPRKSPDTAVAFAKPT